VTDILSRFPDSSGSPPRGERGTRNPWARLAGSLLLAAATVEVFRVCLGKFSWESRASGLELMIRFTAYRPFVYRILVPVLIRVAELILPLDARTLATAFMFLSLVGFVFALRYLYTTFWKPSPFMDLPSLASVLGLVLLLQHQKLYDLTTLFLFTLALSFLARGRFRSFLVLFPFACLNRETSVLLIPVFAVHSFRSMDRRTYARFLGAQVLICLVIWVCLLVLFRDNPTALTTLHLRAHLDAALYDVRHLIRLTLYAAGAAALMIWRWKTKPEFLRTSARVLIPLQVLLYFLVGAPFEMRIFAEVYPIIILLAFAPGEGVASRL
jgi:hypothetical protein